jgi:hypothetical protein
MNAIEPQVRRYCQVELDALDGVTEFDVIKVLGATLPMRVIGMLLGVPEAEQQSLRDQTDKRLHLDLPDDFGSAFEGFDSATDGGGFGEYLDWRIDHPSDDVMTQLVHAEFEDHTGITRTLTREEVLGFVNLAEDIELHGQTVPLRSCCSTQQQTMTIAGGADGGRVRRHPQDRPPPVVRLKLSGHASSRRLGRTTPTRAVGWSRS